MVADIAIAFHWPLSEMLGLSLSELSEWHVRAIDRLKIIHGAGT